MVNISYQAIKQPMFWRLFANVNEYKVSKFEAYYREYFCLQYLAFYVFFKRDITGGPSSSCEMIILRNNSYGGIIRICMGIFMIALRNKIIHQILNKISHLTSTMYGGRERKLANSWRRSSSYWKLFCILKICITYTFCKKLYIGKARWPIPTTRPRCRKKWQGRIQTSR